MQVYSTELIEKRIRETLSSELNRSGLLYRLHSRVKDRASVEEKMVRKSYGKDGKLMQDLIGFRITTYFADDLQIVVNLCQKLFENVELVYDEPSSEVFKPLRKNMVCRMPKEESELLNELKIVDNDFSVIDSTFEIQFRTTLSEGWHEVDHLMRYKCKSDWEDLTIESRMLNGIYASLETNDQTLKALFEDISYHHYKARRWEAMLRNKFRLRFNQTSLAEVLQNYLNENPEVGKRIFKLNRSKVLELYINSSVSFPTSFDNWLYFINYCFLKDEIITSHTTPFLLEDFIESFE